VWFSSYGCDTIKQPSAADYFAAPSPAHVSTHQISTRCKKGKVFPYSLPSVGPGADPGAQAVSPQVTLSHPPGGRLPLLSARPAVTSVAFTRWRHHYTVAQIRFQVRLQKDERLTSSGRFTHQLHVELCASAKPEVHSVMLTGKVCRPETDVLPLCHATNTLQLLVISTHQNLYFGKN